MGPGNVAATPDRHTISEVAIQDQQGSRDGQVGIHLPMLDN